MTKEEFVSTCQAAWGEKWKRPASLAVGRSQRMLRKYETGANAVPEDVARTLRAAATLGPAGEIIKSAIIGKYPPAAAHAIASDVVSQMESRGILPKKPKV